MRDSDDGHAMRRERQTQDANVQSASTQTEQVPVAAHTPTPRLHPAICSPTLLPSLTPFEVSSCHVVLLGLFW